MLAIVLAVSGDLGLPEVLTCRRPFEKMAVVPMPETAVYEDHRLSRRKHKVRLSRQLAVVKVVAKAECMQSAPDDNLRLCILAPDSGHHPAADSR